MLDLTRFSDMLSQFNPGFNFGRPIEPEKPVVTPVAQPAPDSFAPVDLLELSRVPSNSAAASFDRASKNEAPAVVAENGTYRPTTVRVNRQVEMAFSFEFTLSIERQTSVVQQSRSSERGDRARYRALESTSLLYQSGISAHSAGRSGLGGSYSELRSFQTELFYSRTQAFSTRLDPAMGRRFEDSGRRVARSFELEISLDVSFLSQFSQQSESLSGLDSGLFEQYLDNTDGLAARSGVALQTFFGEVDRILQDTEGFVQETLGGFFDEVRATFGLSTSEVDVLQSMVTREVTRFFEDVDTFLAEARATLGGFETRDALSESEAAPAPEPEAPEATLV